MTLQYFSGQHVVNVSLCTYTARACHFDSQCMPFDCIISIRLIRIEINATFNYNRHALGNTTIDRLISILAPCRGRVIDSFVFPWSSISHTCLYTIN